jgi:hypothetical protein
MTFERRWLFAIALVGAALSIIREADAQVHWDVGVQAGATERLTTGHGAAPTPGPSAEIHGHIAVIPMVRVGPYAAFDLSPVPGSDARQVYAAGLRAKLSPPWLSAPWHAWAFLGIGFADACTSGRSTTGDASACAGSDGILELPAGVGVGHRLHGPWELYAELGARVALAHGSIRTRASGAGMPSTALAGDDLLAVSLSVGVSLTR